MPKITKKFVESTMPGEKEFVAWDNELRGFGIRIKPSGVRSYVIQYRNRHGRSRRMTVGTHGRVTAEEARKQARHLLSRVAHGLDPADERRRFREIPTLAEFAEKYFEEHAPTRKKAGTIETDRINWRVHIKPALGNLPITAITRSDVSRLMQSMKRTPGAANRTIQLLSNIMNVAERWGLKDDNTNPCRHVERYTQTKRERFLSSAEFARLGDVLREAERTGTELPSAIAAIRLLILTGCRRGEILSLRWKDVDLEHGVIRLLDSKTGPRSVLLNGPAIEVLRNIKRVPDNPYVIVGTIPGAALVNLKKPWNRVRAAAGLQNVRLHDLRHSFASFAIGSGVTLPIISELLGHSSIQTTERYTHLADDPVRAAGEQVGHAIAAAMNGVASVSVAIHGKTAKPRPAE
jgi:integrase